MGMPSSESCECKGDETGGGQSNVPNRAIINP